MADAGEISKSAKRRAAKKTRDAAAAEGPAAQVALPPKADKENLSNAKAGYPQGGAAPKAKAKAQQAPPAPEAKPKAGGKAAEPKAVAAEPKVTAKAAGDAKQKAAPKPKAVPKAKEAEEEQPLKKEEVFVFEVDDGTGGDWEVSTGLNKKQQKRKDRLDEEKKAVVASGGKPGQPVAAQNHIPGMAPPLDAKAKAPLVDQSVAGLRVAKSEVPDKTAEGNVSTVSINVPEAKIGIVIGPKGAKIKMIQEKTGVKSIDTTGNVFTISGSPDSVSQAQAAIKELIEKGYTSLSYDNFSENFVNVHPSVFPDIIGKQGAVIRKIKEELGTEVNIPETPKNAAPGKKFKVTIAGSAAAVEKTKAVLNEIIMYGHSEITHPGQAHEELEVAEWCYRYLIGKGGSEMRHIQNNYKVKVNIPRESSANANVVVVGEKDNVERAKAYIDKVIWNAENVSKGRDRGDGIADDGMGEEEVEEDWMKAYIFKR